MRPRLAGPVPGNDAPIPPWWTLLLGITILGSALAWQRWWPENPDEPELRREGTPRDHAPGGSDTNPARTYRAALDLEGMARAIHEPRALAAGRAVFELSCGGCHAKDGGGGIGPNLTDGYWLHGNSHANILGTIADGIPGKGMPPWRGVLRPEQLAQVAAHVATLYGSRPALAKAPQGEPLGAPIPAE